MSDKTVPTEADDYKDDLPVDESHHDREAEQHDLVQRAKSHPGEVPNRDEDEFTNRGLKTPDIETDLQGEENDTSDK